MKTKIHSLWVGALSLGVFFGFFGGASSFAADTADTATPAVTEASSKANRLLINRLEAAVNATVILRSELPKFRETARLRQQLDPLFSGTPMATKGAAATDDEIVEFLINEKIIAQQFPIGDTEVEQEINSIQANNRLDRAALKQALSDQGFKFPDYFELIRISISKRTLIDREIRAKVSISDDDVKNYFYNHYSKNTPVPRSFRLEAITIPIADYKNATAAYDVANRAKKALEDGESFEEVAKRFNSDGSVGDLGVLSEDQMNPMIREEAKKLKIGEHSGIFGGPAAHVYMILKLASLTTGSNEQLEKMKEEIRAQLATTEYQHQISLWIERQKQSSFIHRAGESTTKELPVSH